jgi:hypothetical protein
VYISKFLQGIECDLLEATKECKAVIELLRAERFDESIWDELYQSALDLSEPFVIHKMVSIEGHSTGFTASSISQSEVGI